MGVGVGDMIRGVPGVRYCCDMARRAGKEWKGGSTRLEPKTQKHVFRIEGCVAKFEWSGWFGCSRLAIVTFSLLHCYSACSSFKALDMAMCAENLCNRNYMNVNTMGPALRRSLGFGFAGAV